MDPYRQAKREHDDMSLRLRNKAMMLAGIVAGSSLPEAAVTEDVSIVNQTKSSQIAEYVRRHPKTPVVVRACLAVLALATGGLGAWLLKKRAERRRSA